MGRGLQAGYKKLGGFGLNALSDDELEEIHLATLEVLQDTGVQVHCDEALDVFDGGGAIVDRKTKTVKIPPYVVEDAITSAPSTVLLAGRNPKYDLVLQARRVGFMNFGVGVLVEDPYSGEIREATKQDLANTALACDAMDNLDGYIIATTARDVPVKAIDMHEAEAFLSNTSKHCMHGELEGGAHAKKFFEMAGAIVGGVDKLKERPIISTTICPTSPLQLHSGNSEVLMEFARAGLPCNVLSMAMSGASAPVTLAGTLVTHNAEVLSGIVLSQLTQKGAPNIYGSSTTTFDLNLATAPVGAPELGMIGAAVISLSRYYNLPGYVAGG
jgi:trimethylamine--corrinoid protein Co-methyltransferase